MMIDIELEIIAYLGDNLNCGVYADVPASRPDEFVTIEAVGGDSSIFLSNPQIAIQCYALSRAAAATLAHEIHSAMQDAPDWIDGVLRVSLGFPYNFPDESLNPRYQIIAEIVTI